PAAGIRRPAATVQPGSVEFRAHQLAWWRLGMKHVELIVRVRYEVTRGLLFGLALALPAGGWEVESVDLATPGLLRSWGGRADQARLQVELRRPLRPGQGRGDAPTLTVRLRPIKPISIDHNNLPFPDPVPSGARFREGALAIDLDERTHTAQLR